VDEGMMITMDGSKSSDADDGIALYLWKQVSGIPVTLSDSTAIQPKFTAPKGIAKKEALEFSLNVKDNGGLQSADSCVVSVEPVDQTQPLAMHVAGITINLQKGRGNRSRAIAYVSIVDDFGNTVNGATVTGNWTLGGKFLNTSSAATNGDGTATLVSKYVKKARGNFAVSITDVVKDGFIYDPIDNTESAIAP
jgi:hypothetical protein